jgi:hypothetical protein
MSKIESFQVLSHPNDPNKIAYDLNFKSNMNNTTSTITTINSKNDINDEIGTPSKFIIEMKSIQPFSTKDEYLFAMKEDLAEWFNSMYQTSLCAENFTSELENGVVICFHANNVMRAALKTHKFNQIDLQNAGINIFNKNNHNNTLIITPSSKNMNSLSVEFILYKSDAKPQSFQSRDNISNFIKWCRYVVKVRECLMFETDDLILRKNEKNFILCLLEIARYGSKFGIQVPTLIQLEQEIEAELEREKLRSVRKIDEEEENEFCCDKKTENNQQEIILVENNKHDNLINSADSSSFLNTVLVNSTTTANTNDDTHTHVTHTNFSTSQSSSIDSTVSFSNTDSSSSSSLEHVEEPVMVDNNEAAKNQIIKGEEVVEKKNSAVVEEIRPQRELNSSNRSDLNDSLENSGGSKDPELNHAEPVLNSNLPIVNNNSAPPTDAVHVNVNCSTSDTTYSSSNSSHSPMMPSPISSYLSSTDSFTALQDFEDLNHHEIKQQQQPKEHIDDSIDSYQTSRPLQNKIVKNLNQLFCQEKELDEKATDLLSMSPRRSKIPVATTPISKFNQQNNNTIVVDEDAALKKVRSRSASPERDYSQQQQPKIMSISDVMLQSNLHTHVCSLADRCTCERKFSVVKIGEGKYRIGNTKNIVFIRVSTFCSCFRVDLKILTKLALTRQLKCSTRLGLCI